MAKADFIGEVKGLGKIFRVDAPLDEQISAFQREGITHPFLVTPEETSMIRLAGLPGNWTRTSIAPVGVKGEPTILYKPSPFMNAEMARIAVAAHNQGDYPTLDRVFYEAVKEKAIKESSLQPEDRTAHLLKSNEDCNLTSEMDDTRFILGRQTKPYFDKLVPRGSITLYNLTDLGKLPKDRCVVNYLWFPSLSSFRSSFAGTGFCTTTLGRSGC